MNRFSGVYTVVLLLLFNSCAEEKPEKEDEEHTSYLFERLKPEKTGVDFQNRLTETDSMNILDYLYFYNGGGVAIGDINNDDLPDIFFTANQESNRLYLNKGGLKFEDISDKAGIAGKADWSNGVTMADVNADGFLDIYMLAVSGVQGLKGKNELFINNGDGTFTDRASEYGVDLENYGTSAAFFDYDNDGDLDLYVLNHAVHTEDAFGPADIRERRNEKSGDKLFEFADGKFTDVSEQAGIFGGPNAYGLGLATADFNNDGFTDIYISNDFHEDDYLYMNNGDGTFRETLHQKMVQVSRFSMGSDVADINHDGYPDLLSLDMLPEDEKALKSSVGDEDIKILELRMKYGYHRQFSRNMLQLNNAGENFQEIALLSGIAATDWSWSALFGDYDMDGEKDLFISNGIAKRPNDLDYIKYISNNQIIQNNPNSEFIDREALKIMPEGEVPNYFFKGAQDLQFTDTSREWVKAENSSSNGSAYGDLDNDGDLDLVTNNLNSYAAIYKNSASPGSNYLKIRFKQQGSNPDALGTKVYSYHNGTLQYQQLFTSKGFQSSSEAIIHFGYGKTSKVDSLLIIWPDQRSEKMYDIRTNQSLVLSPSGDAKKNSSEILKNKGGDLFTKVDSIPGFDYKHRENAYNDFDRQKLIPYRISDKMPSAAVGDINNDGLDDIFIGNSRGSESEVFFQTGSGFRKAKLKFLEETRSLEITDVSIADFNGDGLNDIFYVTGGGEYNGESGVLKDALWVNDGGKWKKNQLPEYYSSAGVIKPADFDKDGDLDVFIGGYAIAGNFGKIPESFLLENTGGKFEISTNPELKKPGMITDVTWDDMDKDGFPELILVGEWMSPKIFKNNRGILNEITSENIQKLSGLWQNIEAFDIDDDGDRDYLLGNWGTNSKFQASPKSPLRMYYGDVDQNGSTETILAKKNNGKYYTFAGLDELVSQMNFLKKKFPKYEEFAGKDVEGIFGNEMLENTVRMEVTTLESGYLKNENGNFNFIPFNKNLQFAPINTILVADGINNSGGTAVLGGNYFGVTPYHGAFGAFPGALIFSEKEIKVSSDYGMDLTGKAVNEIKFIEIAGNKYLIVFLNDKKPSIYKIKLRDEIFE
ncbi:VCBS repeat-containing protein [Salegentibacter chungangensis]|uniref:VCBS repeat-containing protein n=1 Tax=Salegentibacter chungangensis TaxID=1335724 RepID=A0ABW3NRU4_9FLAO